ncbi:S-layer homology domain-containing protein [Paenibacillus psychroresistens]|uniref:S-layer homology domain-containing protein n=1 Tax=Paenibacillus psychroresistens TaxID=1778678 RepID=A0A6B8RU12_9BACL|nr:S-layer homology domain-containing protein [Paenibacillus psychroresistens]QGQ99272.1 S-layer homology domain-containing protein [Paenibacillus psychroresistens]
MKMKYMTIFVLICFLSMQMTAFANTSLEKVEFSQQKVTVGLNSTEFSVGILVTNNAPFSGAEFGLGLEGDLKIKSIDYTSDIKNNSVNMNTVGILDKNGVQYFGFFNGKNNFNGTVTICNVTFEYTGNSPAKITMKDTNVTTVIGNEGATKESLNSNIIVNVNRESAGNPATPTSPPTDSPTPTPTTSPTPTSSPTTSPTTSPTPTPTPGTPISETPTSGTPTATPVPSATPAPSSTNAPTLNPQDLAVNLQKTTQQLNELLANKENGADAQTVLKKETDLIEKAIEQQSILNISSSIKVDGNFAKAKLDASTFTDLFKTVHDNATKLIETLTQFDPNADKVKINVSLDLGTQTAANAEVPLNADLVSKAKEAGIDTITIKINGVSLSVDVDQFIGNTILFINKQPVTTASDATGLKVASDVYNFEFKNDSGTNTSFTKPVIVKLPINTNGLNTDLLSLAKIINGKLEFYGGRYNTEGNYFEGERKSFSTYVIVENKVDFTDTASVQTWAGQSIDISAAKGIIQGRSQGLFAPNAKVTRAEFAAMIVKAFHLEDDSASESFNDVNDTDWFKSPVAAAAKAGVINGRSLTQFAPNATISRAEMATLAAKALITVKGYKYVANTQAILNQFKDNASINSSLIDGVALATSQGIIVGSNNNFNPNDSSTRAQAAVVIARLLDK